VMPANITRRKGKWQTSTAAPGAPEATDLPATRMPTDGRGRPDDGARSYARWIVHVFEQRSAGWGKLKRATRERGRAECAARVAERMRQSAAPAADE
jgi:hypothetical protein